ncbi:FAD-binding protein [Solirubrobacter soli]|uniref:FAD-binding protein n=1 Tax=Solirubrobacter soli TaxID=363832 RepID=UPI000402754C|nr:FAD-binding protein [Solirubrobacter soli]
MIDLLVVGGGQAGLAAGAAAAARGLSAIVCEKAGRYGGSAYFSAGILWTAPDVPTLTSLLPDGDPDLGRVLVEGFEPAVAAARDAGVPITERWTEHLGFGVAYRTDIHALHDHWASRIDDLRLSAPVRSLLVEDGCVVGAVVGGEEIRARAVLLATGGFQGDRELVKTFLGWDADRVLVRSNPWSVGDGFRMARDAGGAASAGLGTFYGHTVASPLTSFEPSSYLPLAQYHSKWCILVNRLGRRYHDEALGDEVANQLTLRQPGARGVLLCDDAVRRVRVVSAPYPHGQVIDRFEHARSLGARIVSAPTVDELIGHVGEWGVDAAALRETLEGYSGPNQLREAPFWAVEFQPTITFTLGGVKVDAWGRVLDRDGARVPGLYCAGGDAGGLQGPHYVAGLMLGMIFGPRAVEAVVMDKEEIDV